MFMHLWFALVCVHSTVTLEINEEYYHIHENVKLVDNPTTQKTLVPKLSEIGCAMACISSESSCIASYTHSTNKCVLYISGSWEYETEPANGTAAFVKEIKFSGKDADTKCKKEKPSVNVSNPVDCGELNKTTDKSCIYEIFPENNSGRGFEVYCEMEKHGGGWTVIQRRLDGTVNFYRNWDIYKIGFGNLKGEFWLGNENLHQITRQGKYKLRIDMEDFEHNKAYAEYSKFSVGDEKTVYELEIGGYHGNADDALSFNNGQKFSAKDKDVDAWPGLHCAQKIKGGRWYNNCHHANLNGLYLKGYHESFADGVNWKQWRGYNYSLKGVVMMIRRD